MKKTLSIAIAALLVAAMAIPSLAGWQMEEAYYDIAFGVKKAAATWTPDGVYTPGEYFDIEVDPTWRSSFTSNDANQEAAQNLEYKLGLSWDETYLYTFVQFTDQNGHDCPYGADPGNMWQAGALQISLSGEDEMGDQRLEYGIGYATDIEELVSTVWGDYLASGLSPVPDEDYTVKVDGDVVTYEARTPFTAFAENTPKEGETYGICLVISWGNGTDNIHTQLAEGCTGNGKDAGAFAKITLEAAGEVAPAYTYPNSGTDGTLITGEIIGNEAGWGDNADAGRAAAFDGNPATFFDPLGVGDGFCGVKADETYILDKAAILSRDGWADRFVGAMIQGSNDGENWTTLYTSDAAAASTTEYTIITDFENNTGYTMFRYYNETNHGDVAEVEFYGHPGKVEEAAPAAEETVEAPAAETTATTETVAEAPQTFDFGVVSMITAVVSLAGYALTKKR